MISRIIRHALSTHSMAVEMRSASKVDSPVSSRELPTDLGTATRSPKERHKPAASTHGCGAGRLTPEDLKAERGGAPDA